MKHFLANQMKRIVLGFWILKSGEVSFSTIDLYSSVKAENSLSLKGFHAILYVNWISNVCVINETFFPKKKGHYEKKTVAPNTMKNVGIQVLVAPD